MQKISLSASSILFIIIALAALMTAFVSADFRISPYVAIAEARSGKTVQLIGIIAPSSSSEAGCTRFSLSNAEAEHINVEYCRPLPAQFFHAKQIAVSGHFDRKRGIFIAEKLLYKCPEKYEKSQ